MTDEGDVPSVLCKVTLRGPKSMRKLDYPSRHCFYVPGLTPRPNSTEISLQLPENIGLFAVCRIYMYIDVSKETQKDTTGLRRITFIYIYLYDMGDRT
jgi:hypothetical protein